MKTVAENINSNAATMTGENMHTEKDSFAQKLLHFFHDLDSEFPLSGGETPQELSKNVHYMEHKGTEMLKDAHTGYPLSGA